MKKPPFPWDLKLVAFKLLETFNISQLLNPRHFKLQPSTCVRKRANQRAFTVLCPLTTHALEVGFDLQLQKHGPEDDAFGNRASRDSSRTFTLKADIEGKIAFQAFCFC